MTISWSIRPTSGLRIMTEHNQTPSFVPLKGAIVAHWASVIATSVRPSSSPHSCHPISAQILTRSMTDPRICAYSVYIPPLLPPSSEIPGTQVCHCLACSLRIPLVCSHAIKLKAGGALGVILTSHRIRGRWPWAVENMIKEHGKETPVGFHVIG